MLPIQGWALVYSLGTFLAGTSIAIFALSSVYDRINLRRYEMRLDYLRRLDNMMRPSELIRDGRRYLIEIDPLTYFEDAFIMNLWDNIFSTDRGTLSSGTIQVARPPNFDMERQKRLLKIQIFKFFGQNFY